MARELGEPERKVTVVATGGLAPLLLSELGRVDVHEPWLTLIGLRLVFDKNVNGVNGGNGGNGGTGTVRAGGQ